MDSVSEEFSGIRKTYKISYSHPDSLPARDSWGIDHWGFYNHNSGKCQTGSGDRNTLLPLTNISGTNYGGADRSCDTAKVKFGMIDSIIYPTGGYTKFTYESNDFSHTQVNWVITINYINMNTDAIHQCYQSPDSSTIKSFYVDHEQYVTFNMNSHTCGNPQDGLQAYVGVQGVNNFFRQWKLSSNYDSTILWLDSGHYQLFAWADAPDNYAQIQAIWKNCDTTINSDTIYYQYGGGVRIKRIINFDGRQSSIRHFIYRLSSNNSYSSGTLMGVLPEYTFTSIRNYGYTIPGYDYDAYVCSVPYITLTANTVRQQGVTHGNHVGYSEVTELLGENGENGKIIHGYRVLSDIGGDYFPFPPKTNLEWERGMETSTITYNRNGSKRKEEYNYYQSTDINSPYNFHSIYAVKMGWRVNWQGLIIIPSDWLSQFSFAPYENYCGWTYKYKTVTITRDTLGLNPINDSINFYYEHPNNNLQITKISHFNSDGVEKIRRFRYPEDYSGIGSDTYGYALSMMRDSLHMIKSVIEYLESERKTNDTTEMITEGNINLYSRYSTSDFLDINPYKSLGLETITPISLSSFTKSSINNSGQFAYDSHFLTNKVTYDLFDKYGNLLHYFKTDNIPISYNWGYNNSFLITKAVNSSYDPNNNYSGSTAQVTRYYYDHPLIGVSRIVDLNGHSTYYYYDSLGRLNLIKNDDNNILKKIDYHYKTN